MYEKEIEKLQGARLNLEMQIMSLEAATYPLLPAVVIAATRLPCTSQSVSCH